MKRLICLFLICLLVSGCSSQAQETCYYMNTVMDLQFWGRDSGDALTLTKGILKELETDWSATDHDSLLNRRNRGEETEWTQDCEDLMRRVKALSVRTGGAFDPTLRALSEAWGFYNETYRIPSQEEIDAALADDQMDLGAALKGYAGSQIVQILQSVKKVDRALLNLGGNIQTYGEKADGTPWKIGIQDPDGGDYLGVISVTGTKAIVTSGDYQRYFEVDGVRYHHILDPETGYPADSGLRSVTVICADGLTADCLSTALFVMGLEESAKFWRSSDDFEAVFITADGAIWATEGANLSGCNFEVITR